MRLCLLICWLGFGFVGFGVDSFEYKLLSVGVWTLDGIGFSFVCLASNLYLWVLDYVFLNLNMLCLSC